MPTNYATPFTCVMRNVPSHVQDGKKVCKSYNPLKHCLINLGFLVKKVTPVWNRRGEFTETLLIEFGLSEEHKKSAFKLERIFKKMYRDFHWWAITMIPENGPYLWVGKRFDEEHFRRPMDYVEMTADERLNLLEECESDNAATVYATIVSTIAAIYPE